MTENTSAATLAGCDQPLCQRYDVALLDLDGVVYVGPESVPHAATALRAARGQGLRLAFVTNNAARTPQSVADHLTELGVDADVDEVVTSAQAAAHELERRLGADARVLVLGTDGLFEALRQRGLTPVTSADDDPEAVVQGYAAGLGWRDLAEGALAINRGLLWVATNLDRTLPSPRGPLPGNGSLVAALRHATGRDPDLATGKPDPTMHRESVERSGAQRPLIVGDRLDTDIEGAARAGCDSMLVFTGVSTPADVLTAPPHRRPTYLGRDLRALLAPHPVVGVARAGVSCGRWRVGTRSDAATGTLTLRASEGPRSGVGTVPGAVGSGDDDLDALRALAVANWQREPGDGPPTVTAGDDEAAAVLGRWGLSR